MEDVQKRNLGLRSKIRKRNLGLGAGMHAASGFQFLQIIAACCCLRYCQCMDARCRLLLSILCITG